MQRSNLAPKFFAIFRNFFIENAKRSAKKRSAIRRRLTLFFILAMKHFFLYSNKIRRLNYVRVLQISKFESPRRRGDNRKNFRKMAKFWKIRKPSPGVERSCEGSGPEAIYGYKFSNSRGAASSEVDFRKKFLEIFTCRVYSKKGAYQGSDEKNGQNRAFPDTHNTKMLTTNRNTYTDCGRLSDFFVIFFVIFFLVTS